jgi:hypothetical protein
MLNRRRVLAARYADRTAIYGVGLVAISAIIC